MKNPFIAYKYYEDFAMAEPMMMEMKAFDAAEDMSYDSENSDP